MTNDINDNNPTNLEASTTVVGLDEEVPTTNSNSLSDEQYEMEAVVHPLQLEGGGAGRQDSSATAWCNFDRLCKCFFLVCFLILAGLLLVGYLVWKTKLEDEDSNDSSSSSSSDVDTATLEEYFGSLLKILSLPEETAIALRDPTTPASEALQWLAFEDKMLLSINDIPAVRQRFALVILYFATDGGNFWDKNWLQSGVTECDFDGVICNDRGHVIGLDLPHQQLTGELPKEISWLISLEGLNLRHNRLRGSIPTEIFTELTNLNYIELSYNEFTNELPQDMSALTKLDTFYARANSLSGSLPAFVPTSLERLVVTNNYFEGSIPRTWFGRPHQFQVLDISHSSIDGTLPSEIAASWPNLKSLGLAGTQIGGTIPSEIGLMAIEEFSASETRLSGSIPVELYRMSTLQLFVAGGNYLSGTLLPEIKHLSSLSIFNLVNSKISGTIPTEIGDLSNLEWLQLAHNMGIRGTIPTELKRLTNLGKH